MIFLAAGVFMMPKMMEDMMNSPQPNLSLFGLLFLNNILYLASLAALVFQCAQKGTIGPNRYGPDPTSNG